MTKKSSSNNDEINIPESINKPKENVNLTVDHPESKTTVSQKKISENTYKSRSRFAPKAIPVEVPSHGFLYTGFHEPSPKYCSIGFILECPKSGVSHKPDAAFPVFPKESLE